MKPQRVQLRRSKGWRMPPDTIKVDRSNRTWGNPFRIGAPHPEHGAPMDRATTIRLYELHLRRTVGTSGYALCEEARVYLRGKNLACWCADWQECHADVLLRIANETA